MAADIRTQAYTITAAHSAQNKMSQWRLNALLWNIVFITNIYDQWNQMYYI